MYIYIIYIYIYIYIIYIYTSIIFVEKRQIKVYNSTIVSNVILKNTNNEFKKEKQYITK